MTAKIPRNGKFGFSPFQFKCFIYNNIRLIKSLLNASENLMFLISA